jgi:hypothetical protein
VAGAVYEAPFIIPRSSQLVLAYAERDNIGSQVERIPISWDRDETVKVERGRPATWKPAQRFRNSNTRDSYGFIEKLKKYQGAPSGVSVIISGESGDRDWIELQMNPEKRVEPAIIEACLAALRKLQTTGQVMLEAESIHFEMGQDLLDWVEDDRTTLQPGEVQQ